MKKQIKITRSSKSDYWYTKYVNGIFVAEQEDDDCYIVRTPSGTSNIILKKDAEEVRDES